jgi:Ulp1 family protease
MHHVQLPTQTNNYDCGLFVLAYQRATQHWLRTYLPSQHTPLNRRRLPMDVQPARVAERQSCLVPLLP